MKFPKTQGGLAGQIQHSPSSENEGLQTGLDGETGRGSEVRITSAQYGEGVIVSFSTTHISQLMYELVREYDGRYLTGAPLQVFFPSMEKFREFETTMKFVDVPINSVFFDLDTREYFRKDAAQVSTFLLAPQVRGALFDPDDEVFPAPSGESLVATLLK